MLTWALNQGAEEKNIRKAIESAIRNVHNAGKKRFKRESHKTRNEQVTPSTSVSAMATFPSTVVTFPPASNTALKKEPDTLKPPVPVQVEEDEQHMVIVTAEGESASNYYIGIPRGLNAADRYQHLRSETIRKIPDENTSKELRYFTVGQGGYVGAIIDDGGVLGSLLRKTERDGQDLILVAHYGTFYQGEIQPPLTMTV